MKADLREEFWKAIQEEMIKDFGNGHPRDWQKPEIDAFRFRMNKRLQVICRENDSKARLCNVPTLRGNFEYHRLQPLSYDAFRKIFKVNESKGGKLTRNQFAIYFGAESYEDYLLEKNIKAEVLDTQGVSAVISGQRYTQKRKNYLLKYSFVVILILLVFAYFFIDASDSDKCIEEILSDNQFVLVTTDDGLSFINPKDDDAIQILVNGPHFTGFDYDEKEKLVFWSNTNHNYRSIGRANLTNGLKDQELNHRYIKDLPYPLGIALDVYEKVLYLADYGKLDELNDGSIRAYDYDGKLLKSIYRDSIDPSSIVFDSKSEVLYWTDPLKNRIGRFNLKEEICEPNFLNNVGENPDGMAFDGEISRLYWASNKDSLIGFVDVSVSPLKPILFKLPEPATALAITSKKDLLLYSTYEQEKIKWLELNENRIEQSDCGFQGINVAAGSPRVVQVFQYD